jgi:Type II CAAX prenyl endopeptidase Rce1-like
MDRYMQGALSAATANPRPSTGTLPAELAATFLVVATFFVVNYAFSYGVVPAGGVPLLHPMCVFVLAGTALPALLIGRCAGRRGLGSEDFGAGLGRRHVRAAILALVVGALAAAQPIGSAVLAPGGATHAARLFALLLVASIAEVLVFTGLLFHVCEMAARGAGVRHRWATALAVLVSSIAFGLFHFSYPPPWASWGIALQLVVVWLVVSVMFITTRSLLAAIVFNNVLALIGFVVNDADLPGTAIEGLVQAAVAALVAIVVIRAATTVRYREGHA